MVSGSVALLCSRFFSPFPHGTGSLSVSREYLALRDGPRKFARNSSCSGLLRCRLESLNAFAYGAVTRCGPTFQSVRLAFSSSWRRSYNPARRIATPAVWALPRSLATTCGIILIFSSYGYLDVSVPHVRPRVRVCRGRASTGCPIRTSPDLGVFATPRSFSQLITSFFAFESLGILHMPFFAFFYLFALRVFTLLSCLLVLFRLLPIRQ